MAEKHYYKFGYLNIGKEEVKEQAASTLNFQFEVGESDYLGGNYYRFEEDGKTYKITENFLNEDNEYELSPQLPMSFLEVISIEPLTDEVVSGLTNMCGGAKHTSSSLI